MADKQAKFAVRLIDRVTKPARSMAMALGRVTKAARAGQRAGRAGRGLGGRSSMALPKLNADGLTKDQLKSQKRLSRLTDRVGSSVTGLASALAGAAIKATLLAGAVAGIGAAFVIKGIAEATVFAERMRFAFGNLTGSARQGEVAFQKAISLSQELGLNVQDTADSYRKLLAAQFSAGRAETLIKLTSDLKAIGATAEETKSAIRAITQIKAKGRLQAEELVGQLAEAGIATTLVYEELAKSLNVDVKKVPGIITSGAVDADTGIDAIEKALLKKAGIKKAGDAGKRFAEATLAGMVERLKNAPGQLFLRIAEAGKAALPKIKSLVQQIEKAISGISPAAMAVAFERVIDLAQAGITLSMEFASGFSEGFGQITEALQPGDIATASAQFRELGRNVAQLTVFAIDLAKGLGRVFSFFNSDAGKAVLATGAIVFGLLKLVSTAGAVAAAFGATAGTGVLASLGSFGVGAALVTKGVAAISAALIAAKAGAIAFGSAALAAVTPLILPFLALAGAFTAAYFAARKLFDLVGVTKWAEGIGSRLAGWTDPISNTRAGARAAGTIATETPGHPYAAAGITPRNSALVRREDLSGDSPALGGGAKKAGDVSINQLTVQLPQSATSNPRTYAAQFAAELKNSLGGVAGATAGG